MGLLDNKTRIFDTIVTQEGRRQISTGQLQVKFASFSDAAAFYEQDLLSGSIDASSRVYLEAHCASYDSIVFENDDSGRLIVSGTFVVQSFNGKIISGSTKLNQSEILTGSAFASAAGLLLSSSIENFKSLRMIGTVDPFLDETEFEIEPIDHSFVITENSPLTRREIRTTTVEQAESLFQDKRLSHIENFQYLPPTVIGSGVLLGNFPRYGSLSGMLVEELDDILKQRPSIEISFKKTSRENNLLVQMFEQTYSGLLKLDMIDFGQFSIDSDERVIEKHIFFVGKLFKDGLNVDTFVNMFTLVFEHDLS